jgi:hypothetical protein
VQGQRFGTAADPYFRTAVHELGHALGLRHNTADNGFMNTTGVIAGNPGTFPANIQWSFNDEDAKKLRHMPDAWVRPGEIPWAPSYTDPNAPDEVVVDAEGLVFNAQALMPSVPIGAPVRIHVQLRNESGGTVPVPSSLTLKSEHVSGRVIGPHGEIRTFRSILGCVEDVEIEELADGGTRVHDLALIRGFEGHLFPAPGAYTVEVRLDWEIGGIPIRLSSATPVMVTPPEDEGHARAALDIISEPDVLLTMAVGSDLEDGVAAYESALTNAVLRPHFAVSEAKRLANGSGQRKPDLQKALKLIDKETVLAPTDIRHVAEIVDRTTGKTREKVQVQSVISTLEDSIEVLSSTDEYQEVVRSVEELRT